MTRRRIKSAVALILVLGIGWTVLAWFAARSLLVGVPLDRADAIIVLSGSACVLERTAEAAELYKAKVAQRVVLTNDNMQGTWSSDEQRNPYFYERARDNLILSGVPREQIEVIPNPVTSTYDEATTVRDYVLSQGLRSIVVVTSGYHSRRALWTWERVFRDTKIAIGLHPVQTGIQTPSPLTWWLHARGWQMVAGEYLKSVYYRVNVG